MLRTSHSPPVQGWWLRHQSRAGRPDNWPEGSRPPSRDSVPLSGRPRPPQHRVPPWAYSLPPVVVPQLYGGQVEAGPRTRPNGRPRWLWPPVGLSPQGTPTPGGTFAHRSARPQVYVAFHLFANFKAKREWGQKWAVYSRERQSCGRLKSFLPQVSSQACDGRTTHGCWNVLSAYITNPHTKLVNTLCMLRHQVQNIAFSNIGNF